MSGEAAPQLAGAIQAAGENGPHPLSANFRAFFEMMEEGVCIIERVDKCPGQSLDFRYVAVNRAFAGQSGVADVLGKTIREVVPGEAEEWFQSYAAVLQTGEPARFERELITQNRILEVSAFRMGDETHPLVAVIFKDVTGRRRAQRQQAFLLQLDDAVRALTDPEAINQTAARLLGNYLRVSRCAYGDVEEDQNTANLAGGYNREVPSVLGRYLLADFGADCLGLLRKGQPYAVVDTESDPRTAEVRAAYRQISTRSSVCVPLLKKGRLAAVMSVQHAAPRQWMPDELELLQQVANRCWESIERARAVRELEAREQRYRFMAESIPQMVWTATPDGMLDFVSEQVTRYFGAGSEKLLGAGWLQWVHPEDRARSVSRWQHSLATGEPYEVMFRLRRASDASWRWHLGRAQPLLNQAGEVVQWFGTCTDIEDQKQAEAHLHSQWRTFDTALSHTPDFTYIFDLEGRFSYVNRSLLDLWGKSLEEACGKNFFELEYPAPLAERLQRQIQDVIQTKQMVRDHTPFTGPTGETRHYEYIFVPVLGTDGQVEAVTGSTRDITEREQFEKALAASEAKLQQVFAQAPVAILVLRGPEFMVELANPSYQDFIPGREMVGRAFGEVIPELSGEVWDAFHLVLNTGEPFVANDFFVPFDHDGDGVNEDHWFNVVYHPLRESDGSVSGIVAVCSEVTVQVRARRELERANRELEEFAFVSSHDLQEPLRMVNIYTQLLLRRFSLDDPDAKQFAGFITQGVKRMEALIRDLLTYSRSVQRDEMPVGKVDLSAALEESLSVLMNRIEESGAVITADALPTVAGDEMQMAHVFQNLLSNALKYRKPNEFPCLHISAREERNQWVISIQDNGIGFEQQYAERIFGLFKRLHKEEYPGTGLGLAICQRIVERYGGHMWAESKPGEGSIFFFSLPRLES